MCVLVYFTWLLDHLIYLKLRGEQLLCKAEQIQKIIHCCCLLGLYLTTWLLDVLWGQQIKLIQVALIQNCVKINETIFFSLKLFVASEVQT